MQGMPALSVRELVRQACACLQGDSARLDAELLLAHVLGCSRSYLYAHADDAVAAPGQQAFQVLIDRRRDGEPIAYLTGHQEFWTLDLQLDGATLVPRPETELAVELALASSDTAEAVVLDLGTGSGAIALALASERPGWRVTGVDLDPRAVAVASANAARLGLGNARFVAGDWYQAVGQQHYSLIVSNPPYISAEDDCLAGPGLRHEPLAALVSGSDGLDALRVIVAGAPAHLLDNGWLLCEHGAAQGAAVRALFDCARFVDIRTARDLAGLERVTLGRIQHG
jgi:release factor glutamine methyltransferase